MKADDVLGAVEKQHLLSLLQKGKRIDGRTDLQKRPLDIEVGVIKKAEGSAMVTLGDTKVVAGVKCELGTPFDDTPDDGVLILNIELSPIGSPNFESGPPRGPSIEMSRVVDRGIREANVIDVKKLCVVSGEKVWLVFVDIYVLDDNGNLFDASAIAAMAALATTKIPSTNINEEGEVIVDEANLQKLPLTRYTASTTFAIVKDHLIVDPTLSEERISDKRFTVAYTEDGTISAMQKGLPGPLKKEILFEMIDIGKAQSLETIKDIKQAVEEYQA